MKKLFLLSLSLVSALVLSSCQIHGRFTLGEYYNYVEDIYEGDYDGAEIIDFCTDISVEESITECENELLLVVSDSEKKKLFNESKYVYKVSIKTSEFNVKKDYQLHTYTYNVEYKFTHNKGDDKEVILLKGRKIKIKQFSATSWKLDFRD